MFILASQSPRRQQLLKEIVPDFSVVVSEVDEEKIIPSTDPFRLPIEESILKAKAVAKDHPDDEILACDTVVLLDGHPLGKPKNRAEAVQMLRNQSGKEQLVISGYTHIFRGKIHTGYDVTTVYFDELSDEIIERYIDECQPFDKAGAYGIQDEYGLIKKIEGSYSNVMGLPLEKLREDLSRFREEGSIDR